MTTKINTTQLNLFLILFLFFIFFQLIFSPNLYAKDLAKIGDDVITTEELINMSRSFLSEDLTVEQIETLDKNGLEELIRFIWTKQFLFSEGQKAESIKNSIESGEIRDLLIKSRVNIISESYLNELAKGVVTDEILNQQYTLYKTEMEQSFEYTIEAITTDTKEKADQAQNRLTVGDSFYQVVNEFSVEGETKSRNGKIGSVLSSMLHPKVREEIKDLRAYQHSKIIEVQNGDAPSFWIFRYTAKQKPQILPFDQVKSSIVERLTNQAKQQRFNEISNSANIEIIDNQKEKTTDSSDN